MMKHDQITINDIKEVIKPVYEHVEQDGGDIEIIEISDNNIIIIKLLKACAKCKLSKVLFKEGMLSIVRKKYPQIMGVEIINE
ncbi:MAG: NifU family protein [Bacteroidales bacterium]